MVEIRASGPATRLSAGITAAFAAIERVHRLMSFHEAHSDVARINAAPLGSEVVVDAETCAVLHSAREFWHRSGGAFDVAIAPRLVAAGLLPRPQRDGPPLGPASRRDLHGADCGDLELLPGCAVRWRRKSWIDLGGIAKGYAVDAGVAALRAHGITCGLVNAGGDLRGFGRPWPIRLRSPQQPGALLGLGTVCNAAVASSAGYFAGARAGAFTTDPLVDPRSGSCVAWNASITVIADRCMVADALTKVVRLAPASLPALLAHYCAQAVVVDEFGMRSCGQNRLQRELAAERFHRRKVAAG